MAPAHTLRIRRSDTSGADDFVLVNVVSNGPDPLDLRLTGTENAFPYLTTIQQKRAGGLRAEKYNGSEEEWVMCLRHVLLHQQTEPSTAISGVETSAAIDGRNEQQPLTITVRRNIGGITVRVYESPHCTNRVAHC